MVLDGVRCLLDGTCVSVTKGTQDPSKLLLLGTKLFVSLVKLLLQCLVSDSVGWGQVVSGGVRWCQMVSDGC